MVYYLKFFFLVDVLLFHAILAVTGKILSAFNRRLYILYIAHVNKLICHLLCFILSVHVRKPKKIEYHKGAVLYVGNHLSYLDVLAIGCCYPTLFVTSIDMGEHKSEGWLTSNAGSVYVERRPDKLNFRVLNDNITALKDIILLKCPLCIFPEATSANDSKELLFHSSLFSAVENAETTIVPFSIKYTSIDGQILSKENEGIIYFYRGQLFVPHIKKLLHHNNIKVIISILADFSAKNRTRKEICNCCKIIISENLNGKVPNCA
jgi:1-acyl-sn-glycerol-3-phosphate acyltransferase